MSLSVIFVLFPRLLSFRSLFTCARTDAAFLRTTASAEEQFGGGVWPKTGLSAANPHVHGHDVLGTRDSHETRSQLLKATHLCFGQNFHGRSTNHPNGIFIYIFNLSSFSKNNRLNQNFRQMYIWRRSPRRLESLPPRATAAGEPPTVGNTGRWGQYLTPRPCRQPPLLPHSSLQIFGFQPLRSASEVCFLNLVRFI
jgi:hypothetical protein